MPQNVRLFSHSLVQKSKKFAASYGGLGRGSRNRCELLEDNQLSQMLAPDIKEELRKRHLRVTERKVDLLARLKAALVVERERVPDGEEDDDDVNDQDEENNQVETFNNFRLTDERNKHRSNATDNSRTNNSNDNKDDNECTRNTKTY